MILFQYTFFEPAFRQLINAPAGGMSRELERQGDRIVEVTKQNLGVQYQRGTINTSVFPRERLGNLRESITRTEAHVESGFVVSVEVYADPARVTKNGWNYAQLLREGSAQGSYKQFEFITDAQIEQLKEV